MRVTQVNKQLRNEDAMKNVRLTYSVFDGNEKVEIWIEVPCEYSNYLVTETIDPFCIIFCNYAMEKGEDIQSTIPITRTCINNLNTYIKIMSDTSDYFHYIHISAPVIETPPYKTLGRRGTGCSCGVDSLYTILNIVHERKEILTDLVLMNCGNFGGDRSDENMRHFHQGIEHMDALSRDLHMDTLWIDTNIHEIYEKEHFAGNHSIYMRLMGCISLLGKYFDTYYVAADYHASYTKFGSSDGTERTVILDSQLAGISNLQFICIGLDKKRIEKVDYITNYPELAGEYLNVCLYGKHPNCCKCVKCERTMLTLYLLGDKKILKSAFNPMLFSQRKIYIYSKMIAQKNNKSTFWNELWEFSKMSGISIPLKSYLMCLYYWPRYNLNKIKWMRRLYLKYKK